ncbi:MAG: hypothetical protein AUG74_07505 [Bacteroidetes bacterium 13_1_20CM_4_60_6]|nr:MAG: hypothetical protein AUG74_07505 [Bacteroidetes bacterium 13_1_20CM_4_60_6]
MGFQYALCIIFGVIGDLNSRQAGNHDVQIKILVSSAGIKAIHDLRNRASQYLLVFSVKHSIMIQVFENKVSW